jgi:hypothetical protein
MRGAARYGVDNCTLAVARATRVQFAPYSEVNYTRSAEPVSRVRLSLPPQGEFARGAHCCCPPPAPTAPISGAQTPGVIR